ncbi:hypothetical protein Bca4012_083961 [Brassica carinata]
MVKMVSEPEEWLGFASYLEETRILKRSFHSSEIILYIKDTQQKGRQSSTQCQATTVFYCPYGCEASSLVYRVCVCW